MEKMNPQQLESPLWGGAMKNVKIVYQGGLKSPVGITDEKCTSFQAVNPVNEGLGRDLLFLPHGKNYFTTQFSMLKHYAEK